MCVCVYIYTYTHINIHAQVRDAVSMWQNVHVIHAFRALDEFAREQAHFRRVVLGFRRRFPLRPARVRTRMCLFMLYIYV